MFLYIVVGVLLIVILYHALFIVVDVRRIVRRVESVTNEVESVVMKPLSMTDQIIEWIMQFISQQEKSITKAAKSKKK